VGGSTSTGRGCSPPPGRAGDAPPIAFTTENLAELGWGRIIEAKLEANPTQEGIVGQVNGLQVGREDEHLLEGHLQALTRDERQVIDMFLERYDPAVQQFGRADLLATEIIDQQYPAVGLELERCFVVTAGGAPQQIQPRHRQLTAGHHQWAFDAHPAMIQAGHRGALDPGDPFGHGRFTVNASRMRSRVTSLRSIGCASTDAT
jgi:hypothetical protein